MRSTRSRPARSGWTTGTPVAGAARARPAGSAAITPLRCPRPPCAGPSRCTGSCTTRTGGPGRCAVRAPSDSHPGHPPGPDPTEETTMTSARTTVLHQYEHFAWRSLVGLASVIAGAAGFGLLLLLVRSGWPPLVNFDRNAVDTLNHAVAGDRVAVTMLTAVTGLGGRTILFWLVTVSTAIMLIRRQYQLAAYLVVTGLGALALDPAIKALVGRLRPLVPTPFATAPGYSFPSGHTLDATVFYGVMLLVFLPIIPRRLRKLAIGLVIALVIAIGFSRVAIGVYYPSDVIGGWLLGVAWLAITAHAFGHWRTEAGQPPRHLSDGLAPEAAAQLGPTRIVPVVHPWLIATRLVVSFVLIGGALFGLGKLITGHAPAFDEAVPRWLAGQHSPQLDTLSSYLSQAGNTHWI